MLERLVIRNLAVIEELDLELRPGLTALSGETGAGKSIIVDALNLLLGGRAESDLLRSGTDKAIVQGVFTIDSETTAALLRDMGLYEDNELIIIRELTATRSTCRVNGRVVSVNTLKEIGVHLVDMHGQHDHQSLLKPEKHLLLIDAYAGTIAHELLISIVQCVKTYNSCTKEIEQLSGDERERSRLTDLLAFQVEEIDAAKLQSDEEDELRVERSRLLNFEKLRSSVERAYTDLYLGQDRSKAVVDALGKISADVEEAARLAPELSGVRDMLEQVGYLLEDAVREIGAFRENLTFEPLRQEQIEARLDLINKLKRKYGDGIEQIFAFRAEAAASLERIVGSKDRIEQLEHDRELAHRRYKTLSTSLGEIRTGKGRELAAEAEMHIRDLGMKNARLTVDIRPLPLETLSTSGGERMEFLFSANPGEDLKPLNKIASGGEMSRVMLGLKAVFSQLDSIPTLVFDEIDSGVGGKAAQSVAEKIAMVARNRQVLCVTHLAQIASVATTHLCVAKTSDKDRTTTSVTVLDAEARVKELARMLSGHESAVALEHARELLNEK